MPGRVTWFGAAAGALVVGLGATLLLGALSRPSGGEPFAGSCSPVSGLAGPEDIALDPAARQAFISSYDPEADGRRGAIHLFSLDDPLAEGAWRDRTGGAPARFEPVGLSLYDDGTTRRLFVANTAAKSVELFDVGRDGDLAFVETFTERRLTSPSDVVAVGPRAFYVANDLAPGRDTLLGKAQGLARTPSGRVFLFDGVSWRVAADGLKLASGVGMSPDGRRLYVTEEAGETLAIYDRDTANGNLTLARRANLGAAGDKLNVDPSGAVWIGGRPKSLFAPSSRARSVVLRYDDLRDAPSKARLVFSDDGEQISAATVAARLGRTLLIASPVEKKFLLCETS